LAAGEYVETFRFRIRHRSDGSDFRYSTLEASPTAAPGERPAGPPDPVQRARRSSRRA
jgi:hypothetical protein